MEAEYCIKKGAVRISFEYEGRYVSIASDRPSDKGACFGVKWPGGSAVVKEGHAQPLFDQTGEYIRSLRKEDVQFWVLSHPWKIYQKKQNVAPPRVFTPRVQNGSTTVYLQNHPITRMGHALGLAMGGEEARAVHKDYMCKAFGTIDHPFQDRRCEELDDVIRRAYTCVSLFYAEQF